MARSVEPSLEHFKYIDGYMRGCALGLVPADGALRMELAGFVRACLPRVLDTWVRVIGAAFAIQESQWPEVHEWMHDAALRWIRHIEDPDNRETYEFLHRHARHGFISHFPASRFLAGQMKLKQILDARIRSAYAADTSKRDQLLALLEQDFNERIMHVTDFFVAGREDELLQQEDTYRKWLYQLPAGTFTLAEDSAVILEANLVGEKMVRFSRDQLLQMTIWDLIPFVEHARIKQLLAVARAKGHSHSDNLHLRASDQRLVPVFFNVGRIEYGPHHFFQTICVDTSERHRLESQLIQSEKMAAIGQLAAGIAHEIRNPLGIIANALYDLGELVDSDNSDVIEDLRIAKEEMARAQEIINNLLEFSRESRAELEVVDINDLLRRTLQLMNKSLKNSGVRVSTEFGALGNCMANQNGLRQIFLNLITNAVQAMPSGGELRLRTAPLVDGRVQLEFADTGVGIPAEHLQDIFNPFFTTKAPGQGTGLGLSVVHSVVRRYRGEIRVESQVNRGTTFTIDLPCPSESPLGLGEMSASVYGGEL